MMHAQDFAVGISGDEFLIANLFPVCIHENLCVMFFRRAKIEDRDLSNTSGRMELLFVLPHYDKVRKERFYIPTIFFYSRHASSNCRTNAELDKLWNEIHLNNQINERPNFENFVQSRDPHILPKKSSI